MDLNGGYYTTINLAKFPIGGLIFAVNFCDARNNENRTYAKIIQK